MVRAIQITFRKKFGKAQVKSDDNFNTIAAGLAYSYQIVKGN